MALMRWSPLRELENLEREFGRMFDAPLFRFTPRLPALTDEAGEIDMYETNDSLVVKAFLSGVKPDDVKVTVGDHVLEIDGETREDQEIKREQYHRQEHRYGKFMRTVSLPLDVDTGKADAAFDNGVLTVTMPKMEAKKARTVNITVNHDGAGGAKA